MNVFELTYDQLVDEFQHRYGKGAYHAAAVYREGFRGEGQGIESLPELQQSPALARRITADLAAYHPMVSAEKTEGELTKFVTRLGDGLEIESVVIPMYKRLTVCVSSQVGCRMGCTFCETAQLGLQRNLTVAEIVGQVITARKRFGREVRNVVFMGMGEPFDNFENLIQAIRVLSDQRGLDIAPRYITVSTVGRVDGIRKLAAANLPNLNLAVSLNASNDDIRSRIMPVNLAMPMATLREALMDFPLKPSAALFIEYVLIKGVNDSRKHAKELADYLRPLPAKLNLIGYNPRTDSPFVPPEEEDIYRFRDWLIEEKVFVRLRSPKGRSVMAACGQLGNRELKGKKPIVAG